MHTWRKVGCCLVAAVGVSFGARATDYYLVYNGNDGGNASSLSGAGNSQGWSTTPGGAKAVAGITAGNAYYVYSGQQSGTVRTPASSSYTMASGASLTLMEGATLNLASKSRNNTVELTTLVLMRDSTLRLDVWDSGCVTTFSGNWVCDEGSFIVLGGSDDTGRRETLAATVTGAGVIAVRDSGTQPASKPKDMTITGDLSGFTGGLAVEAANFALALEGEKSIPSDPVAPQTAAVTLAGGRTLRVKQDWTSGEGRSWDFGDGAVSTVEVASGKTLVILGEVAGSVGLSKTGAGTLSLGEPGAAGSITITGTGTVSAEDLAAYIASRKPNFTLADITERCMYTGAEVRPAVTALDADGNPVDPSEYTVTYSGNVEPGIALAVVTGKGGVCTGTVKTSFRIHGTKAAVPDDYTGFDWLAGDGAPFIDTGVAIDDTVWQVQVSDGVTVTNSLAGAPASVLYAFSADGITGNAMSLERLEVYRGANLVREFVPCLRNEDHEPGLYDFIDGRFYSNVGAGRFAIGDASDFAVDAVDVAALARPTLTVRDCGTGEPLTPTVDYEIEYLPPDENGVAAAIVTGAGSRTGTQIVFYRVPGCVTYVDAAATGAGDGSSWENAFTTLHAALRACEAAGGGEVWIAARVDLDTAEDGVTFTNTVPMVVRGGFSGTEDSTGRRPAGAVTACDGGDERTGPRIFARADIDIERIRFVRMADRGFHGCAWEASALSLTDCDFVSNGCANAGSVSGRGCLFEGARDNTSHPHYGTVRLTGCRIEDNTVPVGASSTTSRGVGVCFSRIESATLSCCSFARNGIAAADLAVASKAAAEGAAFYVTASGRFQIDGCSFVNNRTRGARGILTIADAQDDSSCVFANCRWVGNEEFGASDAAARMIYVYSAFGGKVRGVSFDRCTFAYNLTGSSTGSAALNIPGGSVTVRNSIFFGNVRAGGVVGPDIYRTDASLYAYCAVDYSFFSDRMTCFVDSTKADMIVGDHNVFGGDPQFATSEEDFLAEIADDGFFRRDRDQDFDVHLLSKAGFVDNAGEWTEGEATSRLIDAGDPAAEWRNEPSPNGRRLNLGAYGNTAEASMTPGAQPRIGSLALDFPTAYTQPRITIEMSADAAGDDYLATVTVICGSGGSYPYTNVFERVCNGDVLEWNVSGYFDPADTVDASVVVVGAEGTEVVCDGKSERARGSKPYWIGHGGPTDVIHVFPYATGKGDGTSWTDAYTDFREALTHLSTTRRTMWVSTNVLVSAVTDGRTVQLPGCPIRILGGFSGEEDDETERVDGRVSSYDGAEERSGLQLKFAATPDLTLLVERFRIANCSGSGATVFNSQKRQASTFEKCEFVRNGRKSTGDGAGIGLSVYEYFQTSGYGEANLRDCVFEDNVLPPGASGTWTGAGYWTNVRHAGTTMRNCVFRGNGVAAEDIEDCAGNVSCAAVYAKCSTTFEGCRFVGNRANAGGGTICKLENVGTLRHCLYSGNEEYGARADTSGGMALLKGGSVDGCTFAYNLSGASAAAAAINLAGGTLSVSNSIFYGNVIPAGSAAGADLQVQSGAVVGNVDYTLFADNTANCVNGVAGAVITNGTHNVYGDARFVTRTRDFLALVKSAEGTKTSSRAVQPFGFDHADPEALKAINCHLAGGGGYYDEMTGRKVVVAAKSSPAIDAGDPDLAFDVEPRPNGGRLNLGFYGNTPWATMSKIGTLIFVK